MDKTATNLARLRAYDENPWDESEHPRAENGRFTSGGGNVSGGDKSKSSKWEHEQNIKLMKDLEKAEKNKDGKIVIGWIIDDMRNGMSTEEAFAKADKNVRNGKVGGGPLYENSLRKWWKNWSSKWEPQEED